MDEVQLVILHIQRCARLAEFKRLHAPVQLIQQAERLVREIEVNLRMLGWPV